MNVSVS